MGGALLETNARRIKNEGRVEGRAEGKIEVFLNLIADGIPRNKAQRLADIDDSLVEKALKSHSYFRNLIPSTDHSPRLRQN